MEYCAKDVSYKAYGDLLGRIVNGTQVVWARYGDGEFSAIYHKPGRNASGHAYFPDNGDRLRQILESSPSYDVGLQRNAVRKFGDKIQKDFPNVDWVTTETLHDVSQDRGLNDLFSVLRDRKVTVVGPHYMTKLDKIFDFEHIEVPIIDCWLDYERVLQECKDALGSCEVMCFIAAMLSNVVIDDLSKLTDKVHLLDIGAAFDPYAGVKTRGYHKNMTVVMPEWVK